VEILLAQCWFLGSSFSPSIPRVIFPKRE